MKRKVAHILKPAKGGKLPKWVIFFDTETQEVVLDATHRELTLKLGYACLTRRDDRRGFVKQSECEFTDADTFLRWLDSVCKGREKYYITAHNIAFDIRVVGLLKYLADSGWKRNMLIAEGLNFIAAYRKKDTTLQLVNNQQLFNVSLKTLGESIGIAKLEVDFATVSDHDLLVYCKRDVDVMVKAWNVWVGFVRDNDLGSFKLTAASQSMSAYKHRFMPEQIFIHNHDRAIELERESYRGGRVECFFIGKYTGGRVTSLDVNSMYPTIMKELKVPTKLLKYYDDLSMEAFARIREKYGYVVEASVELTRPILPVTVNGRLCFPTGQVRGVFAKPELEYALRFGTLRSVHRCSVYAEGSAFTEFVDFFYSARQRFKAEGNTEFAYISKLLLNSLYGKFGQKQSVYQVIGKSINTPDGIYKSYDIAKKVWLKYRIIDGIVEQSVGDEEGYDSFVAIASYITAGARALLASYIERAGWDNVLYCDTDSVFVNDEGKRRIADDLDDGLLGKLKVQAQSHDVTIFAPKWYQFGEARKLKGIRANARRVGEHTYEQDKFLSFSGGLRSYHTSSVIVEKVTKHLTTDYQKGVVLPDGRVKPFELSEELSSPPKVVPIPAE